MIKPSSTAPADDLLVNYLSRFGPLSAPERAAISREPLQIRRIAADRDIMQEGGQPTHCPILIEGFACSYKLLETGQRQIVAFHIPTDLFNMTSLQLATLDYSIGSLTSVTVALAPHQTLLNWAVQYPVLGQAIWRAALVEAASLREWVVNVGRRSAYQRTAHLLCEMAARIRAAGLTQGAECHLPITQLALADAMGLTPVHVNRTLQWLRAEGLILFGNGRLTIPNFDDLKQAGGFDDNYLHDVRIPAAAMKAASLEAPRLS